MLQHRIDPAYLVARAPGVVGSHDGLQQCAPVHRAGIVLGINDRQLPIAPGLLHPQLQLGFVGMKANCSGCVRAADTAFADLQPVIAVKGRGLDQFECRSGLCRSFQLECVCHGFSLIGEFLLPTKKPQSLQWDRGLWSEV